MSAGQDRNGRPATQASEPVLSSRCPGRPAVSLTHGRRFGQACGVRQATGHPGIPAASGKAG